MLAGDVLRPRQVVNRAGDFQDAVISAGAEVQVGHGEFEKLHIFKCQENQRRCSAMKCDSLSQPAAWSFGTASFRQVSASVGIVRRSGDSLSASTCAALPVNRASFASVGGPVLRRLPTWLGKDDARHHRRESYSKSAQGQGKRGGNRVVTVRIHAVGGYEFVGSWIGPRHWSTNLL
jgi:hypothetical protein